MRSDGVADNQLVTETQSPAQIIKAWLLWGAVAGAVVLVVAVFSALLFGVVGGFSELSPNDLGRSALGVLALPGFALEGAIAGAVIGGLVGISCLATDRFLRASSARSAAVARYMAATLLGLGGATMVGYSFDVAVNTPGIELSLAEWSWVVVFGLLVGLSSYRMSPRASSRT
jgi:hypothetical protein